MNAHEPAGRHLLATLQGCDAAILDDEALLRAAVEQAAAATGATVLQIAIHHFAPHGVTAMALLAESHASLHTYPERGVAFWDCFTCGATCHPEQSLGVLQALLRPAHIDHRIVERIAGDQ
ncbi:MAG TPA: adenosylmethionine decarboxylase [Herpetosiphonaceae bacterium]|nr:adenosylmethionine decarboxylase [Herpetosiphonaceae bacterium]